MAAPHGTDRNPHRRPDSHQPHRRPHAGEPARHPRQHPEKHQARPQQQRPLADADRKHVEHEGAVRPSARRLPNAERQRLPERGQRRPDERRADASKQHTHRPGTSSSRAGASAHTRAANRERAGADVRSQGTRQAPADAGRYRTQGESMPHRQPAQDRVRRTTRADRPSQPHEVHDRESERRARESRRRPEAARTRAAAPRGSARDQHRQSPRADAAASRGSAAASAVSGGASRLFAWFWERCRSSRAFAIAALVVIVLLVAGIVDAAANHDKIYANVSVGEVNVSGMTEEQAADTLKNTYADRINGANIVIYSDQDTMDKANSGQDVSNSEESEDLSTDQAAAQRTMWKTKASTLQARMEYDQLAHDAYEVGRDNGSLPGRLHAFFFGENLTASVSENDKALAKLADSITRTLGKARKNYGITVTDGTASVTEGHDGNEVDKGWLSDQLQQRFTDADNSAAADSFVAQVSYAPVQIDRDQAQATADRVTDAIKNGATFTFKDKSWTAKAGQVGAWVKTHVEQDGDSWKLSPYLSDDKAKRTVLKHITPKFNSDDAKVTFQKDDGGNITVHTSATGDMPMISQAIDSLQQALFADGAGPSQTPSIDVASTPIPDSMTVDEALEYGVISVVSSYTTEYTSDAAARNHNIHLAADLLDNSIITADGGQWSFNDTAGECNADKGFQGAGVIIDGETVDEIGGGICQVATTVFNCVYEGGYDVVTRHNHSLYIASYPDGRDAAVSWPDLDLVWDNDSKNDLLMRTSHTATTVTVELLGVPDGRTVSTKVGSWKEGEKAGKTTQTDNTLPKGYTYVKQYGSDGKSITVVRTVKSANGKVLHNDTFTSVYDARDEIDVKGTAD